MADKEIVINGKVVMYGTSIKGSAETSTNSTPTFDGVVTSGTRNIAYTLEFERVSYDGKVTYEEIRGIITDMLEHPKMVSVREKRYDGDRPFIIIRDYHDCVVDSDDYEIKPEERTVDSLKFLCARMDEDIKYL